MRTESFDYDLPRARIAAHPVCPRDAARLLEVLPEGWIDRRLRDLPRLLGPGDLMVFNDARVLPARLAGRRGEARIEATLERAIDGRRWRAMVRPAKRLRPGDEIVFRGGLRAIVEEKREGTVRLVFDREAASLERALARHGAMPLPPYIPRPAGGDPRDRRRYQTVFARRPGAVAAPTAGLHFTHRLLATLARAGVGLAFVTLEVGAGSFRPVRVDDPRRHRLEPERGLLGPEAAAAINAARERGGRIVAVGTTALRLMEHAADRAGRVRPFAGEVDLFILPGYRFRVAEMLLTNFHMPRSTLFMLACAFAGQDRLKQAYAHAIEAGYRFLSYGDATLLHRGAG